MGTVLSKIFLSMPARCWRFEVKADTTGSSSNMNLPSPLKVGVTGERWDNIELVWFWVLINIFIITSKNSQDTRASPVSANFETWLPCGTWEYAVIWFWWFLWSAVVQRATHDRCSRTFLSTESLLQSKCYYYTMQLSKLAQSTNIDGSL